MDDNATKTIGVVNFNLSMTDPETGNRLQGQYYTLTGVMAADGKQLRPLSIGQLVMAVCLDQAVKLEADIVTKMQEMAKTVTRIEVLTLLQETIINNPDSTGKLTLSHTYDLSQWPRAEGKTPYGSAENWSTTYKFLTSDSDGPLCKGLTTTSTAEEVVSAISSALDDQNTVNQEETINLQSLTNKRDQRYDMITNILKSFGNVMAAIANNL